MHVVEDFAVARGRKHVGEAVGNDQTQLWEGKFAGCLEDVAADRLKV